MGRRGPNPEITRMWSPRAHAQCPRQVGSNNTALVVVAAAAAGNGAASEWRSLAVRGSRPAGPPEALLALSSAPVPPGGGRERVRGEPGRLARGGNPCPGLALPRPGARRRPGLRGQRRGAEERGGLARRLGGEGAPTPAGRRQPRRESGSPRRRPGPGNAPCPPSPSPGPGSRAPARQLPPRGGAPGGGGERARESRRAWPGEPARPPDGLGPGRGASRLSGSEFVLRLRAPGNVAEPEWSPRWCCRGCRHFVVLR